MLTDYQLNCLCAIEMNDDGYSLKQISAEFGTDANQMIIDGNKILSND